MSTAEKVWNRDFASVCNIIKDADAVITFEDGFQAVDQTKVSASTVRLYTNLSRVGYANGWMA